MYVVRSRTMASLKGDLRADLSRYRVQFQFHGLVGKIDGGSRLGELAHAGHAAPDQQRCDDQRRQDQWNRHDGADHVADHGHPSAEVVAGGAARHDVDALSTLFTSIRTP
jgi:hypothetical protein